MPSLDELLSHTQFMQGARGFATEKLAERSLSKPALPGAGVTLAQNAQIWHWMVNSDNPATIRDVTCIAAGMGNGRMTVCDEVRVEDVAVVGADGMTAKLPLVPSFIVRKHHLDGGFINGRHSMYPLTGALDKSLLYAFAYDFPGGFGGSPQKPSAAALASSEFMPTPSGLDLSTSRFCAVGEQVIIRASVPRVLVLLSFTTMRAKADFEPGEILAAGRMNPHVLIMSNAPLREARATVVIARPPAIKMEGGDHSAHSEMNNEIEGSLFADRNDPAKLLSVDPVVHKVAPSPYWDDLFDLYRLGVSSGTYRAVDTAEAGGTIADAIASLTADALLNKTYEPRALRRVARQGAFDNIHIAPTMKSSVKPPGAPYFLDKVYMAPFCEHDCLHTHWRWAETSTPLQNLGWSDNNDEVFAAVRRHNDGSGFLFMGRPYLKPGAPMVPTNQSVEVEARSLSSVAYKARSVGRKLGAQDATILPGTFTFVFHHGSAYSLDVNGKGAAIKIAGLNGLLESRANLLDEPLKGQFSESSLWKATMRYWRLRFGGDGNAFGPDKVMERLKTLRATEVLGPTTLRGQ